MEKKLICCSLPPLAVLPEVVSSMFGKIALVMTLSAEVGARTSLYCATEPSLSDPQYSGDSLVIM